MVSQLDFYSWKLRDGRLLELREDVRGYTMVRGVAGIALATPFFQDFFYMPSGLLTILTSGYPDFWLSRLLTIWSSGHPAFWSSSLLAIWSSGHSVFWPSGHLTIWSSSLLVIWLSRLLIIRSSN